MLAVAVLLASSVGTATSAVQREGSDGQVIARVENRAFAKAGRFIPRLGVAYFSRGDLRDNPSVHADLSWYLSERWGLDVASANLFGSTLDAAASDLREVYGALPDSQKPILKLTAGPRFAFAYGKLLIEGTQTVVHLDASIAARAGILLTNEAPNAALELELMLQALFAERFVGFFSLGALGSYETRKRSSFDLGPIAALGIGLVI